MTAGLSNAAVPSLLVDTLCGMARSSGAAPARSLPVTDRGRRMRAAIIDSAATLMHKQGVTATSLDDVLAAAGCGKSQMYYYFGDKADLVRAVIDRQIELILTAQKDTLDHVDSWDGLDAWAEHILNVHSRRGGPFACPLGTMAAELKNSKAFRPALDAAFRRWEAPLAKGLQTMKDRGELTDDADPARLAAMLIASLQGGMLLARVRKDVTILRDSLCGAISELHHWRAHPAGRRAASRGNRAPRRRAGAPLPSPRPRGGRVNQSARH